MFVYAQVCTSLWQERARIEEEAKEEAAKEEAVILAEAEATEAARREQLEQKRKQMEARMAAANSDNKEEVRGLQHLWRVIGGMLGNE